MMTDEERRQRLTAKVQAESQDPEGWFWLSFVDPDLPVGQRFLGVAVVRARGPVTATMKAHYLKINPGGEVAMTRLPEDWDIRPEDTDRLLDRDAAPALNARARR